MRVFVALVMLLCALPFASADDTCFVAGCVSERQYDSEGCGESAAPPGETFVWTGPLVIWLAHVCGGSLAGEWNMVYVQAAGASVFWSGQDASEYHFRSGSLQAGASAPEGLAYAYLDWYGYEWYESGDCRMTLWTSAGDEEIGCVAGIPPTPPSLPAGSLLP